MNYEARVAKGAAELDRILPGWERKIDLDRLSLVSDCNCVLGQLAVDLCDSNGPLWPSPFDAALDKIRVKRKDWIHWEGDRGFDLPRATLRALPGARYQYEYRKLTLAWKRLIRQRLEA